MMGGESGNPLPADGLAGRLTPAQYGSLRAFWREFFRLIDSASDQGSCAAPVGRRAASEGEDGVGHGGLDGLEKDAGADPSSSGPPPVIKDEKLKEKMRSEQELREAKAALEKYGRIRFLDVFWGMIMMDDPDVIVLKFLRARKWNVSASVAMMAACMKWRLEFGVDEIIRRGEGDALHKDNFIEQLRVGKAYAQGTDRQGRPVVYINVRFHRASDQPLKSLEGFIVYYMEVVRLMLTPPLVEKATIVVDMTGFGIANMDWKSLAFVIKCLEAYYPESLNVLVVHNPPWIFHGLWKIIAPMIDPVVRSKIMMSKTAEDLKVHIDEKHLIKSLGGQNDWTWEYHPVDQKGGKSEDAEVKDAETKLKEMKKRKEMINLLLDLTRKWCEEEYVPPVTKSKHDGSANAISNSTIVEDIGLNAQLRKFVVLHLRVHWYTLDRYVRGSTIYHRRGNIIGNGLVAFEYPKVPLSSLSTTAAAISLSSYGGPTKNNSDDRKKKEVLVDHWEVIGQENCREYFMMEIEKMKNRFKKMQVGFPVL